MMMTTETIFTIGRIDYNHGGALARGEVTA